MKNILIDFNERYELSWFEKKPGPFKEGDLRASVQGFTGTIKGEDLIEVLKNIPSNKFENDQKQSSS